MSRFLDRLSDAARALVKHARNDAIARGHQRVETEHLLVGLLALGSSRGIGHLSATGIDPERLHRRLEAAMSPDREEPVIGEPRFGPEAKKVLQLAKEASRERGIVGTEHILIGLLREPKGVAGKTLRSLGVTADGIGGEPATTSARSLPEEGAGMFDRFTDRARKAMGHSREEAGRLRHDYISTEHMLLGLLQAGDGTALHVLTTTGVDVVKLANGVRDMVAPGNAPPKQSGQLPFTPAGKKVLESALIEAADLGHIYIGTEHLLLGLLRVQNQVAAMALQEQGVQLDTARDEVLRVLSADTQETASEQGAEAFFTTRFTERGRSVLKLALENAQKLFHDYVGTEHLLLGILDAGPGASLAVLEELGADLNHLRRVIQERVGLGEVTEVLGQLPFTPRSKTALQYALREGVKLRHTSVSCGHLLLGLIGEEKGTAGEILREQGITLERARPALREAYEEEDGADAAESLKDLAHSDPEQASAGTPALRAFGRDVATLVEQGELSAAVASTHDVHALAQVLSRRTNNCAVIVSDNYAARLAVIHGLARVIGTSGAPSFLAGMRLVELDLQVMIAGTKYQGMFEERALAVLNEVRSFPNVVLVFDDLRVLAGGRGTSYDADIEAAFRRELLRGGFQCVTTATPEVYESCRERGELVDAVFRPLRPRPPSKAHLQRELREQVRALEAHHGLRYELAAIDEAAERIEGHWPAAAATDLVLQFLDAIGAEARYRAWRESGGGMPTLEIRRSHVEAAWPRFRDSISPVEPRE